ncbi:MAG: hypothetical protein HQL06_09955 [Nitrospirae bacterium]|nr:hypothetical protein [Nitrospirota bacterium]
MPKQTLLYIGDKEITTLNRLSNEDVNYSFRVVDIREIYCCQLLESGKPEDFVLAIFCKTEYRWYYKNNRGETLSLVAKRSERLLLKAAISF